VEDVFRAAAHDTECPELVREGKGCNFFIPFKNMEIVFLYFFPLLANKHSCTENGSEFKLDAKSEKYTYSWSCQVDLLQFCQSEQVLDELSASEDVRK